MADAMVLAAQRWVNSTYGGVAGYKPAPENGKTGFPTMYALTMGLQHELGISPVIDSFGPTTLAALTSKFGTIDSTFTNTNVIKIIQSALYCKGYDGDAISGTFGSRTTNSVTEIQFNMGVPNDGRVAPKVFKALLNMDAYVVLYDGTEEVREIQRWLNGRYLGRRDFFIAPADGMFSRDVQKALLFALQYELGLADGTANGNFGPTTQSRLRARPALTLGAEDTTSMFVHLYQAALTFNGYPTLFSGYFEEDTREPTIAFQTFTGLVSSAASPGAGVGDYQTWASLLVSTGDPGRDVTALDTITRITPTIAANLRAAGYQTVGRYLTNVSSPNALNKKIQPGELADIFAAGLSVFPIYQTYGGEASYFGGTQGAVDGAAAHDAALSYGFDRGTVIYFAVDYDAFGDDIPVNILPHFNGIRNSLADKGGRYRMGIYAPRGVCTRVRENVDSNVFSFVSGMSTGFSGNLGYPLPEGWAFDQIATVTAHGLTFDKVVKSGRDNGANSVSNPDPDYNAALISYVAQVQDLAEQWKNDTGNTTAAPILVVQYISYLQYGNDSETGIGWRLFYGQISDDWIAFVDSQDVRRVDTIVDPGSLLELDPQHTTATMWGYLSRGLVEDAPARVGLSDIAGWAGDFITLTANWRQYGASYPDAYTFATQYIGSGREGNSFGSGDLIEDVDGYNMARALFKYPGLANIDTTFVINYGNPDEAAATLLNWSNRFTRFYSNRFGSDPAAIRSAAESIFIDADSDVALLRDAILTATEYRGEDEVIDRTDDNVRDMARALADVIVSRVIREAVA